MSAQDTLASMAAGDMPAITVTVRYFASIREAMGVGSETVCTTATTLGALRAELQARSAKALQALATERAVRMALDHVMATADARLHPDCEVAFFPPVTGG